MFFYTKYTASSCIDKKTGFKSIIKDYLYADIHIESSYWSIFLNKKTVNRICKSLYDNRYKIIRYKIA